MHLPRDGGPATVAATASCSVPQRSMPHRATTLLTPLLAFAVACGAAGEGDNTEPHPLNVELGSTDRPREFAIVQDGDVLPIEFGFQGGYHIWGAFRVDAITERDVQMRFELRSGGELIGAADYIDDVFETDDGASIYGGVTVFIFDDIDPLRLDEQELVMSVEVEDTTGGFGRDEHLIVADADAVR